MAHRKFASLSLIFMVVGLMAHTWYLMGTGSVVNFMKDYGLITKIELTEVLLGAAFVTGVAVVTLCVLVRLFQAETEKSPDYLIRLAKLLMLFAFGYGIRLFALINKGRGLEVLENGGYLAFMVLILVVTFFRYEELELETGGSQVEVEAVSNFPIMSIVVEREVVNEE